MDRADEQVMVRCVHCQRTTGPMSPRDAKPENLMASVHDLDCPAPWGGVAELYVIESFGHRPRCGDEADGAQNHR